MDKRKISAGLWLIGTAISFGVWQGSIAAGLFVIALANTVAFMIGNR